MADTKTKDTDNTTGGDDDTAGWDRLGKLIEDKFDASWDRKIKELADSEGGNGTSDDSRAGRGPNPGFLKRFFDIETS